MSTAGWVLAVALVASAPVWLLLAAVGFLTVCWAGIMAWQLIILAPAQYVLNLLDRW